MSSAALTRRERIGLSMLETILSRIGAIEIAQRHGRPPAHHLRGALLFGA